MSLTINTTNHLAIGQGELLTHCLAFRGSGFATLVHAGTPGQVKTGSPSPGTITKKSHVQVNWGKWRYGSALEAQAKREGKEIAFDIKPRQWGKRLTIDGELTPLVHHVKKDGSEQYYLEAKVEQTLSAPVYYCGLTGERYDLEDVKPYLNTYRNPREESSTQEGLEKKVYLRDYALTGIIELIHGGNHFQVS